jgi:hypothetical protein
MRRVRTLRLGRAAVIATVSALALAGLTSVAAATSPESPPAAASQYEKKVTICHRTGSKKKPFHTIRVSRNALKAHLGHGDALGPCGPNSVFTMCHETKAGKKQTVKVKGVRKATRALKKGDKLGKCKTSGKKNKAKKGKEKDKGKGEGKNKGPKKP